MMTNGHYSSNLFRVKLSRYFRDAISFCYFMSFLSWGTKAYTRFMLKWVKLNKFSLFNFIYFYCYYRYLYYYCFFLTLCHVFVLLPPGKLPPVVVYSVYRVPRYSLRHSTGDLVYIITRQRV